jgi:hypothetical protein
MMKALVLLLLLGLTYLGVTVFSWLKMRSLKRQRAAASVDDFVRHFAARNVPEGVSREVYRFLQEWVHIPDFPVLPSDDIGGVYGIVGPDVLDTILSLARKCERRATPDEMRDLQVTAEDPVGILAQFLARKCKRKATPDETRGLRVDTVEELVEFLARLKPVQGGR